MWGSGSRAFSETAVQVQTIECLGSGSNAGFRHWSLSYSELPTVAVVLAFAIAGAWLMQVVVEVAQVMLQLTPVARKY